MILYNVIIYEQNKLYDILYRVNLFGFDLFPLYMRNAYLHEIICVLKRSRYLTYTYYMYVCNVCICTMYVCIHVCEVCA